MHIREVKALVSILICILSGCMNNQLHKDGYRCDDESHIRELVFNGLPRGEPGVCVLQSQGARLERVVKTDEIDPVGNIPPEYKSWREKRKASACILNGDENLDFGTIDEIREAFQERPWKYPDARGMAFQGAECLARTWTHESESLLLLCTTYVAYQNFTPTRMTVFKADGTHYRKVLDCLVGNSVGAGWFTADGSLYMRVPGRYFWRVVLER